MNRTIYYTIVKITSVMLTLEYNTITYNDNSINNSNNRSNGTNSNKSSKTKNNLNYYHNTNNTRFIPDYM